VETGKPETKIIHYIKCPPDSFSITSRIFLWELTGITGVYFFQRGKSLQMNNAPPALSHPVCTGETGTLFLSGSNQGDTE
jgi:hypothetical protein